MRWTYAQIHWMKTKIFKKEDNRRHGRMLKRNNNEQKKQTRNWDQWRMREMAVTKPEDIDAGSRQSSQVAIVAGKLSPEGRKAREKIVPELCPAGPGVFGRTKTRARCSRSTTEWATQIDHQQFKVTTIDGCDLGVDHSWKKKIRQIKWRRQWWQW